MVDKDVGVYECFAKNEHGESRQKIHFEIAEYPRVTQHLEETHIRSHANGRIMCRIAGYPPCEVQWYKDWEPLKTSFRLRVGSLMLRVGYFRLRVGFFRLRVGSFMLRVGPG